MAILKSELEICFRLKLLADHFSIEFHNDFLFRGQNVPQIFNWSKLSISGVCDRFIKYGKYVNKFVRVRERVRAKDMVSFLLFYGIQAYVGYGLGVIGREVGGGLGNREGGEGRHPSPLLRMRHPYDNAYVSHRPCLGCGADCVSPVSGITTRRVGASFGGMLRCGQKSAKQGG